MQGISMLFLDSSQSMSNVASGVAREGHNNIMTNSMILMQEPQTKYFYRTAAARRSRSLEEERGNRT